MAFVVGLADIDLQPQFAPAILEHSGDVVQRIGAVDLRLAHAEQVEVRPVDDQ